MVNRFPVKNEHIVCLAVVLALLSELDPRLLAGRLMPSEAVLCFLASWHLFLGLALSLLAVDTSTFGYSYPSHDAVLYLFTAKIILDKFHVRQDVSEIPDLLPM